MGEIYNRSEIAEKTRLFIKKNAKLRKKHIDTIRSNSLEALAKLDKSDLDKYLLLNFSDYEFGEDIIEYRLIELYKFYKTKYERKHNEKFLDIINSLNEARNSFWMNYDSRQNDIEVAFRFSRLLLDIMAQSSDTSQQRAAAHIKHAERNELYFQAIEKVNVFLINNTNPEWTHADFKNYILSLPKFKDLPEGPLLEKLREFFKIHDTSRIGNRAQHVHPSKK